MVLASASFAPKLSTDGECPQHTEDMEYSLDVDRKELDDRGLSFDEGNLRGTLLG